MDPVISQMNQEYPVKLKELSEGKFITNSQFCWVDHDDGEGLGFPPGNVFLPLAEINLYYKVLTPLGTTGWIHKSFCRVLQ
jgi:hypothetical protein